MFVKCKKCVLCVCCGNLVTDNVQMESVHSELHVSVLGSHIWRDGLNSSALSQPALLQLWRRFLVMSKQVH